MPTTKPDPVVLHSGYWWECPTCGREHFGKMVTADLTREDAEQATRAGLDLEPWQEIPEGAGGDWVMMPDNVSCPNCTGQFPVFNETE